MLNTRERRGKSVSEPGSAACTWKSAAADKAASCWRSPAYLASSGSLTTCFFSRPAAAAKRSSSIVMIAGEEVSELAVNSPVMRLVSAPICTIVVPAAARH